MGAGQGIIVSRTLVGAVYVSVLSMWFAAPELCTEVIGTINERLSERTGLLQTTLESIGVPPPYPNAVNVTWGVVCTLLALLTVAAVIQPKARARTNELREKLIEAQSEVEKLHEQLMKAKEEQEKDQGKRKSRNKPVRIFMEGAFDIMHYGHMNAFRQGAALGDQLVVGVNSSESIHKCKGSKPVMNDEERCAAVRACRFVDEVIPKTPYVMTPEYLDRIIKEYDIDFVVHGDDPCYVNGRDVYQDVKDRNMFKSIPVTEGVSTTDIVGRMLLLHKEHHIHVDDDSEDDVHSFQAMTSDEEFSDDDPSRRAALRRRLLARKASKFDVHEKQQAGGAAADKRHDLSAFHYSKASRFYTTASLLRIFSRGLRNEVPEGARVVYMHGAWDMLHVGHYAAMQEALKLGDYLVVGVHNDEKVNKSRGKNYPILNLQERVLSVLGCGFVSDVIIDAPWIIEEEMIVSLNISAVVAGPSNATAWVDGFKPDDGYRVAKAKGIFREIGTKCPVTVQHLVARVTQPQNQANFVKKYMTKVEKERAYYGDRYGADQAEESGAAEIK